MAKEDNKYRVASRYAGSDPRGDMFSGMEEEELKKKEEAAKKKAQEAKEKIENAKKEAE